MNKFKPGDLIAVANAANTDDYYLFLSCDIDPEDKLGKFYVFSALHFLSGEFHSWHYHHSESVSIGFDLVKDV